VLNNDLKLKCLQGKRAQQLMDANRLSRLERSQVLLDRFSEHEVGLTTNTALLTRNCSPFTAAPVNSQNDRVYACVRVCVFVCACINTSCLLLALIKTWEDVSGGMCCRQMRSCITVTYR